MFRRFNFSRRVWLRPSSRSFMCCVTLAFACLPLVPYHSVYLHVFVRPNKRWNEKYNKLMVSIENGKNYYLASYG